MRCKINLLILDLSQIRLEFSFVVLVDLLLKVLYLKFLHELVPVQQYLNLDFHSSLSLLLGNPQLLIKNVISEGTLVFSL